jgi:hypothetical protein
MLMVAWKAMLDTSSHRKPGNSHHVRHCAPGTAYHRIIGGDNKKSRPMAGLMLAVM